MILLFDSHANLYSLVPCSWKLSILTYATINTRNAVHSPSPWLDNVNDVLDVYFSLSFLPRAHHNLPWTLIDCAFCFIFSLSSSSPNPMVTVEGSRNVIRSCGAIKAEKDCYQASNPPTKSIVCQCFEDGCNSATGVTSSFLLISLLFSILLLFGLPK